MTTGTNASPEPETYPEELKQLLLKAQSGDPSVVKELRRELADRPGLRILLGHLGVHAEMEALKWATSNNLLLKEINTAELDALRLKLKQEGDTELEFLLIDRVVMCWITLQRAEIDYARARDKSASPHVAIARETAARRDQTQNLYISAIRALATVRKLTHRVLSPLELMRHPVSEAMPGRDANRSRFTGQRCA